MSGDPSWSTVTTAPPHLTFIITRHPVALWEDSRPVQTSAAPHVRPSRCRRRCRGRRSPVSSTRRDGAAAGVNGQVKVPTCGHEKSPPLVGLGPTSTTFYRMKEARGPSRSSQWVSLGVARGWLDIATVRPRGFTRWSGSIEGRGLLRGHRGDFVMATGSGCDRMVRLRRRRAAASPDRTAADESGPARPARSALRSQSGGRSRAGRVPGPERRSRRT